MNKKNLYEYLPMVGFSVAIILLSLVISGLFRSITLLVLSLLITLFSGIMLDKNE